MSARACVLATMFFVFASMVGASAARADDKDVCSAAYTENQKLRKQGKLKLGREALLRCVAPTCPGFIQTDCAGWLAEVDAQMPSIIVAATGPDGRDTPNVVVKDGATVLATTLDGRAIPLDPGQHDLELSHPGVPPVRQTIIVREGERNRRVEVSFQTGKPISEPGSNDGPTLGPLSIAGFVVGGVGIGALAAFAGLGVTGQNEFDELDETCGSQAPAPNTSTCTDEQIEPVQTKLTVADVMLGVGAGLTAVGLTLIIIDVATPSSSTASATVGVGPSSVRLTVRF